MNKKIYRQEDSRWGSLPYPTKSYSFAGNGCGCCACLHVLIEQEQYKNWTPKNLRPWMVNQGFATKGNGTTWNGITKTLQHYNNTVINHNTMTDLFKTLNQRKKEKKPCLGVILFRAGTKGGVKWTAGGHYVAYVDYKEQSGKHYFYTKDSGGRHHDGWYCYETTMQGLIPQVWSALPKTATVKTSTSTKSIETLAQEVIAGKWGNGIDRKHNLEAAGYDYDKIQDKVNEILTGKTSATPKKSVDEIAKEVIAGKWGNGDEREQKLTKAGYDYKIVQKRVNEILSRSTSSSTSSNNKKKKLKGIDISTWQGKISVDNFKKVKASGIEFVILRVGFTGSSSKTPTLDNVFENNYKNAIAAGLPVGVYFYSLATTTDAAKKEAEFVIKQLKGKKITYPVYIDMEDPNKQGKASKSALASVCNTFCNAIKAAGYKPGVYASLNWFENKIGSITASHTKWVAQYYKECQYKGAYDMWQYTSSGTVNGISGKVDMNYWYN